MSDDRLPTATLVAELREWAQDNVSHAAKIQNPAYREALAADARITRQAADRLEELTAALRPFADIYAKGSHDPSDPADCLRLLDQAKRAAELTQEEPTT